MPVKFKIDVQCDECDTGFVYGSKQKRQTRQLRSYSRIKEAWIESTGGEIKDKGKEQVVLCGKCINKQ